MRHILLSVLWVLMYAVGIVGMSIIMLSVLLIIDPGCIIVGIGGIITGILLMAVALWLFDIIGALD